MKIKILLMPLAIAVSMGLAFWLVWPAYTNGLDGAKESSAKLEQIKLKFSQLESKISNTEILHSQLVSNGQKDILYSFLPQEAKEEEIIDNINYIASSSGLSLLGLNIKELEKELSLNDDPGITEEEEAESELEDPDMLSEQPVSPLSKKIGISLSLAGSYDSIKKFITELYKLERQSDMIKISIKPYASSNAEEQKTSSDFLEVEAEVEFDIMPAVKITNRNMNDLVFMAGTLNTDIFSKIKEARSREILKLNIAEKGKSNPFTP